MTVRPAAPPRPVMHFEFMSDAPARLAEFYGRLFGWARQDVPEMGYTMLQTGAGRGIDGAVGQAGPGLPVGLTVYVQVPDVERALADATALGAAVLQAPSDVPGVGRFAVLTDPDGNRVGLWTVPAEPAPAV